MDLAEALRTIPCLQGATEIVELSGGLTNRNVKVATPLGPLVVRLSSNDTGLLAVNRDHEYVNSARAAEAGVGAEVVDYRPGQGVLIVRFIEGHTFTDADVANPSNWPRIAAACRRLHTGPAFTNDFDMFEIQRGYLQVVTERGFRIPPGYRAHQASVERLQRALTLQPIPAVPCNNDLLAGNFIDTGNELRLIDYEYSGNNDPCFEIGNIWSEANLSLEALEAFTEYYFGHARRALVARCRLMGLMSKYGWTLWASIQDAVSPIDFDFWSWGMEKYERAQEEFASGTFETLLMQVASDN